MSVSVSISYTEKFPSSLFEKRSAWDMIVNSKEEGVEVDESYGKA